MKALILDAGNSRTKLYGWAGPHQGPALRDKPPPLLDLVQKWDTPGRDDDWQAFARTLQKAVSARPGLPLVVTSVIPQVVAALEGVVDDLVLVDHRRPLPFSCLVEDLAAVGADRFCNVAAAVAAGLNRALVVDVGTATTFDLLVDGVFIGGLIAPGPELALRSLGQKAARLHPVPFAPAPLAAGRNTTEAMARGAWHTGIGGINYCIEGLVGHYGPLPVLLTGGLGRHLLKKNRFFDPHLTLRGAAVLAGLASA